jgi:hypothetical protein
MKYAPFFLGAVPRNPYVLDMDEGTWMVIAEDKDSVWYIEVPDAGSREAAVRIADALNKAHVADRDKE